VRKNLLITIDEVRQALREAAVSSLIEITPSLLVCTSSEADKASSNAW
jgi:hypothetical protein